MLRTTETTLAQNWAALQPGQPVQIAEPERDPYFGQIDTMTDNRHVL
jgi:hypothetical protein